MGLEVFGEVLEGEGGQSRAVKLDHHVEVPAFLKKKTIEKTSFKYMFERSLY